MSENSCFIYVVQFSSCLEWKGNSVPVTPSWLGMEVHNASLKLASKPVRQLSNLEMVRGIIEKVVHTFVISFTHPGVCYTQLLM